MFEAGADLAFLPKNFPFYTYLYYVLAEENALGLKSG